MPYLGELIKIQLNVFERSLLCSSSLHLFNKKYITKSNIVKYFGNLK